MYGFDNEHSTWPVLISYAGSTEIAARWPPEVRGVAAVLKFSARLDTRSVAAETGWQQMAMVPVQICENLLS